MAQIPLIFQGWTYDEDTKRIVAIFVDASTADDPDPASHIPSLNLCVEFLPRVVDQEPVVQPEQEQIEQLGVVVDQLVLDMLMSSLDAMNPDMEGLL